jgi:phosphate transport system substrate-binding protein
VQTPSFPALDTTLEISGTSLAPELTLRLIEEYRLEYPEVVVDARPGGTTQALEDLVNRKVDVAFLSRPPTARESEAIRAVGDSAMTFPIALGGIAIVAGTSSEFDSMSLDELRREVRGEGRSTKLYSPDPNRGLWVTLTSQLGVPHEVPPNLQWVAEDKDVLQGVAGDASALGFASMLALPADLEGAEARFVPLRRTPDAAAFAANSQEVASGDYPLFHYLYVSCRPGSTALASGFVTFLFSGRGQRLVSRAGYLPARDVPRLIQLESKPIGEGT